MTDRLSDAFAKLRELDEATQMRWGQWILAEIASERRWDEFFAKSQDFLAELDEEISAQERAGLTEPLTEADFALQTD